MLASVFYDVLNGVGGAVGILLLIVGFLLVSGMYLYGGLISVGEKTIEYTCCYYLKKSMPICDIKGWEIQIGVFKYWDRLKPTVRLEIYSKVGKKPLISA